MLANAGLRSHRGALHVVSQALRFAHTGSGLQRPPSSTSSSSSSSSSSATATVSKKVQRRLEREELLKPDRPQHKRDFAAELAKRTELLASGALDVKKKKQSQTKVRHFPKKFSADGTGGAAAKGEARQAQDAGHGATDDADDADGGDSGGARETVQDYQRYMHGRKKKERLDSVTVRILQQRAKHQSRLEELVASMKRSSTIRVDPPAEAAALDTGAAVAVTPVVFSNHRVRLEAAALKELGFGMGKQRLSSVYKDLAFFTSQRKTSTGAGGFALYQGSSTRSPWPLFKHVLPEVAFTGHSNSGKSTLVNALIGVRPNSTSGLAKAHDRAGWTDEVHFYALGKKPPLLTLADLPGYGHAVASSDAMRQWKVMSRSYLSNRIVLSRCCVLVDCTRGLCSEDHTMLRFLHKYQIPWRVVLTKGDLLPLDSLVMCKLVVEHELQCKYGGGVDVSVDKSGEDAGARMHENEDEGEEEVEGSEVEPQRQREASTNPPLDPQFSSSAQVDVISSNTGAGVHHLWHNMLGVVRQDTMGPVGDDEGDEDVVHSAAVREHRLAHRLRAINYRSRTGLV